MRTMSLVVTASTQSSVGSLRLQLLARSRRATSLT